MEIYELHQTPHELAKELIKYVPLVEGDICLEPFKGTGAFYNSYPEYVQKEWCEIMDGRDYTTYTGDIDWVITNPPFRLEGLHGRRNSFYELLDYYSTRVKKGIAFLGNYKCISTLTPKRLHKLKSLGLGIHSITVCNVKKWCGRYYFIVISKEPSPFYDYLLKVF